MIELTDKQRQQLRDKGEPVYVLDPATSTEYVLVRLDLYSQLRQFLDPATDEVEQEAWADAVDEARVEMANE